MNGGNKITISSVTAEQTHSKQSNQAKVSHTKNKACEHFTQDDALYSYVCVFASI